MFPMAYRHRGPRTLALLLGVAACTSSSSSPSGGDADAGADAAPRNDDPDRGWDASTGASDAAADVARAGPACGAGKATYDLDGDGIVDADQNKLTNGNFHKDTLGWTAVEPSASSTVTWSGANESLCIGTSGTLELLNRRTDGEDATVYQCVKFGGNAEYGVAARGYLAMDQTGGVSGKLAVRWYSDEACTALISKTNDLVLAPSQGSWVSGGRSGKSPVEARSALVTLSVSGDKTTDAKLEFDDVLLR